MKKAYLMLCIMGASSFNYIYGQNSETRNLAPFNKIEISGNSKVYLTPGTPQLVKVESKHELNEVNTVVKEGRLKIDGSPSTIYITIPAIEDIDVSGIGELKSDSVFSGNKIMMNITGKGKIIFALSFTQIDVNISGSGKLKLNGDVQSFSYRVSGNGAIDAESLKTNSGSIDISGVGKAIVDVKDQLVLNVSGVGSVYYKTEPKVINKHVSGIGRFGMIESSPSDTTTVHIGKKRIIIIGNEEKKIDDKEINNHLDIDFDFDDNTPPKKPAKARSHWGGFDFGFNNYCTDGTSTSLPNGYNFLDLNTGKSIHVGINIIEHDFKLYRRYVMFTTGIGLSFDNYRFSSNQTLIRNSPMVAAEYDLNDKGQQVSYSKNKLAVSYVTVPFLLQFNTNELLKKSFHVAAGVLLSYKYDSHLKLVYDKEGEKQKTKRRDEFNIEPFRYDATVRIGFRNYTLFGNYAMSELFKKDKGPSMHPFNIGLQLVGW